jgi:multidrug efflux pump subunit AcrB
MRLGLSGVITRLFIRSPLTPLLLIAALAVGVAALLALPREEEPQISVPLVDIMVAANGVSAADAVELVTKPLEDIVKGIREVEHIYSLTEDDHVTVTARFFGGTEEDRAILRVHEELRANYHRIPVGITEPMIVKRSINDVPIVTLTLSPRPDAAGRWDDHRLRAVAEELNHELVKIDDVGRTFIVGGRHDQVRVEPDPERLALYGVTLNQLVDKIRNANRAFTIGRFTEGDRSLPVMAGQSLVGIPDVGQLVVTSRDGRPVYVADVANVVVGASPSEQRVWHLVPAGDGVDRRPAVTVALAKRPGANAVVVAERIHERVDLLRGSLLSPDLEVTLTRDYGRTADDKAGELLFHLALATVSIVALIAVALGWRAGVVVLVVVPTTILLTLFAAYLLGFTINRVSLFALIFSIGILVDDAIVIVENIVRHWRMGDGRSRMQAAIEGVAEVGNPTIVATLTIIVALLPMMFVSGLMGPYMAPIPAVASFAMAFSFFVAVAITPWLMMVMAGSRQDGGGGHEGSEGRLGRLYRAVAAPLLERRDRAAAFLVIVGVATVASCALFYVRAVTVKLLPFDNKPELQVVVDLPEGASLEGTERALLAAAERLRDVPELTHIQVYAGTAAPFNFNGLVRHSYLRARPHQGDLQINLLPKDERHRASHAIALDVRARLAGLPVPAGTAIKVVEVPPGPPVLATLLAEIYGPDPETRRAVAARVRQAFASVDFIVDADDTLRPPGDRVRFRIEQDNLEFHGVHEQAVYDTLAALIGGVRVGYSYGGDGRNPPEIVLRLPRDALAPGERLLTTPVAAPGPAGDRGANVELGDVVRMVREPASPSIFRRDGRFAEMVTAELAGRFEAPIYGMLAVADALRAMKWAEGGPPQIRLHGQPEDERHPTLLWDGEWEITYVTFRDMGLAFAAAIVGIYLLVVAQFQSFKLPLVVLTPIPLTLIGIVLGHWLFDAAFTATSMIGFIALAGIIVRNSILLVDFIRHRAEPGRPLRDVLLEAGAIRITPIVLTAAAAMIGAAFILTDPIFQGLAVSLVFGLASSTALTLLVIPAIYVTLRDDGRPASP